MEDLERNRPPELAFDVAGNDGGTAIVTIRGDLDIANIERLELAVEPIIGATPDRLVVDVGGLRFADSSAIALWVRWATIVGEIELRDASPLLAQVISSMGLERKLRLTA